MCCGSLCFFTLYIFLCVALSLASKCVPIPMFIAERGIYLHSSYDKVDAESVVQCIKECRKKRDCLSINFKLTTSKDNCFLNKGNRKTSGERNIQRNKKFVYYDIEHHTEEHPEIETKTDLPRVPPFSPDPCDSNPCKNNGTCIVPCDGSPYKCNCSEKYQGDFCETWSPFAYDYDLVFRHGEATDYVKSVLRHPKYRISICAWLYTPHFTGDGWMTVLSINSPSDQLLLALNINREGSLSFFLKNERRNHTFSTLKTTDAWVFLCVMWNGQYGEMKAVVNADFNSKAHEFNFANDFHIPAKSEVLIGQTQQGGVMIDSFKGEMSEVNIWEKSETPTEHEVKKMYNGEKVWAPIPWPVFGKSDNRHGQVRYVSVSSAPKREWVRVENATIKPRSVNVEVTHEEPTGKLTIKVTADTNCDHALYAFIAVPGEWRRIKYKQTFLKHLQCFAVFGNIPSWAPADFPDPGLEEFDPNQDDIWNEQWLGYNNEDQRESEVCGAAHFWMNNTADNFPSAEVNLRRRNDAKDAGIITFGKCGSFEFIVEDIYVLNE